MILSILTSCAQPPEKPPTPTSTPNTTPSEITEFADSAPPPVEETTDSGSMSTSEPLPAAVYAGDCAVSLLLATEVQPRIVFDDSYLPVPLSLMVVDNETPIALVFTEQTAFADWLLTLDLPVAPDAVDFATETAVVGLYRDSTTCWIGSYLPRVFDVAGVWHVQIAFENTSAGCEWQCDHSQAALQVVAVPRMMHALPTVCVGVGGGCSEDPF